MTPNPIIRLQSVVQTLEHVIVPAVDRDNSLAQEQCGLVLAQLRMLIGHMPYIGEYHALCLADIVATARAIAPADGGRDTRDARAALDRAVAAAAGFADASDGFHHVGHALDALLRAVARDGAPGFRGGVERATLDFSMRQSRRARAWFRDAGFDSDPAALPEIADMVAGG